MLVKKDQHNCVSCSPVFYLSCATWNASLLVAKHPNHQISAWQRLWGAQTSPAMLQWCVGSVRHRCWGTWITWLGSCWAKTGAFSSWMRSGLFLSRSPSDWNIQELQRIGTDKTVAMIIIIDAISTIVICSRLHFPGPNDNSLQSGLSLVMMPALRTSVCHLLQRTRLKTGGPSFVIRPHRSRAMPAEDIIRAFKKFDKARCCP